MFKPARRLKDVKISASAAMTDRARELRGQGVKIVSLSSGEPDFPTPLHAIEAAHRAALAGDTKYPPQDGTKALKEAVQRKFKRAVTDSGTEIRRGPDKPGISNLIEIHAAVRQPRHVGCRVLRPLRKDG